jgi:DNA-binding CsgD family transcriptional regulator
VTAPGVRLDDLPAWRDVPPRIRETAERVLTDKELGAIKLSLDGAGYRRIARALGIAPETCRIRLQNARAKLADALDQEQPT